MENKQAYRHRTTCRRGWPIASITVEVLVFIERNTAVSLWGRNVRHGQVGVKGGEGNKTGHGHTHANGSAFSSSMRVSFDLLVGRHGWVIEPMPSLRRLLCGTLLLLRTLHDTTISQPMVLVACAREKAVQWEAVSFLVSAHTATELGITSLSIAQGKEGNRSDTHLSHSSWFALNFLSRSVSTAL
jgi:hypothetical protein